MCRLYFFLWRHNSHHCRRVICDILYACRKKCIVKGRAWYVPIGPCARAPTRCWHTSVRERRIVPTIIASYVWESCYFLVQREMLYLNSPHVCVYTIVFIFVHLYTNIITLTTCVCRVFLISIVLPDRVPVCVRHLFECWGDFISARDIVQRPITLRRRTTCLRIKCFIDTCDVLK